MHIFCVGHKTTESWKLCQAAVWPDTICKYTSRGDYWEPPSSVIQMSKMTKLLRRQAERGRGEISEMAREGGLGEGRRWIKRGRECGPPPRSSGNLQH